MLPEIQCKIEQTVLEILKNSDMEKMTEFDVRVIASERLGIDLTGIQLKKFIRGIIESFLLSTLEVGGEECKRADANSHEANTEMVREEAMPKKEFDSEGNRVICRLSNRRNVVIQDYKGKSFVSIREFNHRDGRHLPTNKVINLPAEQWSAFRKNVPLIEEAIVKMQSKLRSSLPSEQNEQISNLITASTSRESNGQISNLVTASSHELNGQTSKLVNEEVSKLVTASTSHENNDQICDSATDSTFHELVPVEVNRFDGKNYNYWAPLMELFLKQLKIAHVLTHPCPSVTIRPEASAQEIVEVKAAEKKWLNDDYMCRHNILASLSDALYKRYKRSKSAKELWEELKLLYLHEEFGKKRSQVKSYIEFQIIDEKPILEQVQELNNIADSIVAAGIFVDEKFHVSAIISKLPPSWKDFCIKLMCEEHLPFWMLMDLIRMEEDYRNQGKQVDPSNSAYFNYAKNPGPRITDMKKQGLHWKRRETETNNKALICHFCGKKGHISKNCRNKKFEEENSSKAAVKEMKTEPLKQPVNVL